VLPVIGGATRLQPVFVGDVAEAIATLIDRGASDGKTYELGGPEAKTMAEITRYVLAVTMRKRLLANLPFGLARLMGSVAGLLPGAPLTAEQVDLMSHDNVVSPEAQADGLTLQGLGISPRAIDGVVPSYLFRYRKAGQFTKADATG
jgi:NADH dehydrogenase